MAAGPPGRGSAMLRPPMDPARPEPEISVVVPAYNEADSLPTLLGELRAALAATGREWELILVDDGSTDGTDGQLGPERGAGGGLRAGAGPHRGDARRGPPERPGRRAPAAGGAGGGGRGVGHPG